MSGYWLKSLFERGWVTLSSHLRGNGGSPGMLVLGLKAKFLGLGILWPWP